MQKFRLLALSSVFAAFGLMTACDFGTSSTSTGAPIVKDFESANFNEASQIWAKNETIEFYGEVTDDNSVTSLSLDVYSTAGALVQNLALRNTSGSSVSFGKSEDVKLTISNAGNWGASGAYIVRLTAKNKDGQVATKDMNFKYIEGTSGTPAIVGTALTEVEQYDDGSAIVAGTQGSANTSFLSIREAVTYTSADLREAPADWAKIDVIFFASASGAPTLFSPVEARTQGLGSLTGADLVSTKIWKIDGSYESVATSEALAAAIATAKASNATAQSAAAVSGGVYLLELSNGKQAILKVNTLINNGTVGGKYSIDIVVKWSNS